jgi:hypothetical protein
MELTHTKAAYTKILKKGEMTQANNNKMPQQNFKAGTYK